MRRNFPLAIIAITVALQVLTGCVSPSPVAPAPATAPATQAEAAPPHSIVFVLDTREPASEMAIARQQLSATVDLLRPDWQFDLIELKEPDPASLGLTLLPATAENKQKAQRFLRDVPTTHFTDLAAAVEMGLDLHPHYLFVVTGDDLGKSWRIVKELHQRNWDNRTVVGTLRFVEPWEIDPGFLGSLTHMPHVPRGSIIQFTATNGSVAAEIPAPQFGQGGNGLTIAFVCDAGDSMAIDFDKLRQELSKAVEGLHPYQKFSIIFMQAKQPATLDRKLTPATPDNKKRAEAFLKQMLPKGTTNPIPALDLAFQQKPMLMFILTNHDFPDDAKVLDEIRKLDPDHKVKVDTIAFGSGDLSLKKTLKQIADDSGGTFKLVNVKYLAPATRPATLPASGP